MLSGRSCSIEHLVRIVYHAKYGWGVDARGDLPVQGWWMIPQASVLQERALGVLAPEIGVSVDIDGLIAAIDRHLLMQVQSLLSLARRASNTCVGGDRIRKFLTDAPMEEGLLLKAVDGGSEKFWYWLSSTHQRQADYTCMTKQELAAPFSRAALGSVFLKKSGLCLKINPTCAKLSQIREKWLDC